MMGGLSKLNSVTDSRARIEVDVIPGEPEYRTAIESQPSNGSDAYRSKSSGIP